MARIGSRFVTSLYREEATASSERRLLKELEHACRVIADVDVAGQKWALANQYPGYTSYASLLPERDPSFAALIDSLDNHVAAFAKAVDLGGKKLTLSST